MSMFQSRRRIIVDNNNRMSDRKQRNDNTNLTVDINTRQNNETQKQQKKGISPTSVMESPYHREDDNEMPMDELAGLKTSTTRIATPPIHPIVPRSTEQATPEVTSPPEVIHESAVSEVGPLNGGFIGRSIPYNYPNNHDDRSTVSSLDGYSVTGGGHNYHQFEITPKNGLAQFNDFSKKQRDATLSPVASNTTTTAPITSAESHSSESEEGNSSSASTLPPAVPAAGGSGVRIGRIHRGSILMSSQTQQQKQQQQGAQPRSRSQPLQPQQQKETSVQKEQIEILAVQKEFKLYSRGANDSLEEVSSLDGASNNTKEKSAPPSENTQTNNRTNGATSTKTNHRPRASRSSPSPTPTNLSSSTNTTRSTSDSRSNASSTIQQRRLLPTKRRDIASTRSLSSLRSCRHASPLTRSAINQQQQQQPNPSLSVTSRSASVPKSRIFGRGNDMEVEKDGLGGGNGEHTSLAMAAAAVRKGRLASSMKKDTIATKHQPSTSDVKKNHVNDSLTTPKKSNQTSRSSSQDLQPKKQLVDSLLSSLDTLYPSQQDDEEEKKTEHYNVDTGKVVKSNTEKTPTQEEEEILTKVSDIIEQHTKTSTVTLQTLQTQLQKSQKSLKELTTQQNDLKAEMSQKTQQISTLQSQLHSAKNLAKQNQQDEIMTQQKRDEEEKSTANLIQELTNELEELTTENDVLEQKYTSLHHLHKSETSNLQSELLSLQQKHDEIVSSLQEEIASLKSENNELVSCDAKKEGEHEDAILAIQHVLADVTVRKDERIEGLEEQIKELRVQKDKLQESLTEALRELKGDGGTEVKSRGLELEEENDEGGYVKVTKEQYASLKKQADQVQTLQQKLEDSSSSKHNDDEITPTCTNDEKELKEVKAKLEDSRIRERELQMTLERNRSVVFDLEMQLKNNQEEGSCDISTRSRDNVEEREDMKKELHEKEQSLHNAKQIISSLETSNETILNELRDKLKAKEEEVKHLQLKSTRDEKSLHALKTEVSQMQQKNEESERANRTARDRLRKQRVLHRQMRGAVDELAAKSQNSHVMTGTTSDGGSSNVVEQMTSIMNRALCMMDMDGGGRMASASRSISDSANNGSGDRYAKEKNLAVSISRLLSSDDEEQIQGMKKQLDDMKSTKEMTESELKLEREEKKKTMQEMEEAMITIRQQMDKQKDQMEQMKQENDGELIACQSEMQHLRDQLSAKDKILEKREYELELLRKQVDGENAVGYVSDPDDDSEEGSDDQEVIPGIVSMPSAAETFAAQYGQTSGNATGSITVNCIGAFADGEDTNMLKERLVVAEREKRKATQDLQKAAKELQAQKDSLANAKLIISSLEKSNKTMMEDLRSRLQDSNVAIASLLDKSMKHEETTAALKEEIDDLRRKKEEAEEEHKKEVKKYKEEALQNMIKIAAQEKEIMELKSSIKRYADTIDDISLMSNDTHALSVSSASVAK